MASPWHLLGTTGRRGAQLCPARPGERVGLGDRAPEPGLRDLLGLRAGGSVPGDSWVSGLENSVALAVTVRGSSGTAAEGSDVPSLAHPGLGVLEAQRQGPGDSGAQETGEDSPDPAVTSRLIDPPFRSRASRHVLQLGVSPSASRASRGVAALGWAAEAPGPASAGGPASPHPNTPAWVWAAG